MYFMSFLFFFFKQKTAYEMRISDWSSDVCSSDLERERALAVAVPPIGLECGAERVIGVGAQPAAVGQHGRVEIEPVAVRRAGSRLHDMVEGPEPAADRKSVG